MRLGPIVVEWAKTGRSAGQNFIPNVHMEGGDPYTLFSNSQNLSSSRTSMNMQLSGLEELLWNEGEDVIL